MNHDKLIADFMGFTHEKNIGWYDNDMLMPQEVYDNQGGNCFDKVLFGESWDWLMPVVQKCYDLEDEEMNNSGATADISMYLTDVDIQGVYSAVSEFIKQYTII